jgi:hypothetical protein
MEWLLRIKKPTQGVWTTAIGRPDGVCDPDTWRTWYKRGCDFCGYAWGTPPDWHPHPPYARGLEIVRKAFKEMTALALRLLLALRCLRPRRSPPAPPWSMSGAGRSTTRQWERMLR